jgi:hypothetical protein
MSAVVPIFIKMINCATLSIDQIGKRKGSSPRVGDGGQRGLIAAGMGPGSRCRGRRRLLDHAAPVGARLPVSDDDATVEVDDDQRRRHLSTEFE